MTTRTARSPLPHKKKAAPKSGRPQPVTERGQRSREKLLKAAEKVFGERGYHSASIVDIVREADVAQGTFYVHFESKQAVFAELLRSLNHLIRARSQSASAKARDFIEAEELGFQAFFDFVRERPHIYRLIWEAEFVDPALRREHYTKITGNWARRIAAALNEKGTRELDAEAISYCLFGIAAFVAIRWPYWSGGPIPPRVFQSVLRFIRHGMGPYLKEGGAAKS